MATKTFNTRIANKRDTSANWTSNNPVLLNGEVIIVDTEAGQVRYKVGNGTSTYTQLPFTDESLITNINGKLSLSGGTMTGNIDMGGHKLTGLGAPVNPNDAVRQTDLKVVSDEVDGIISGTTGITLAPATTTKIGGVIVGDGIEVEADGTISTNPVPAGGTNGQILTQSANGPEWQNAPSGLPDGGTEGQMLYKSADGAVWGDKPVMVVRVSGTGSQDKTISEIFQAYQNDYSIYCVLDNDIVLQPVAIEERYATFACIHHLGTSPTDVSDLKFRVVFINDSGIAIAGDRDLSSLFLEKPSGGTPGQLLTKTETGEEWADAPDPLPEGGTTGQLLTKTADGTAWRNKPAYTADEVGARPNTWTPSAADVGAVPTTRTVNGQALSADITLDAEDVGARPATWTPSAADVGAVPTSRTVNGKALSSNITLTADDVNAASLPTSTTVTLTTSGWSSNTQTVTVSGVVASETAQLITPTPAIASQSAYYEAGIMCTGQAANSLTFTCQTVPTSNLTVYVVIQPLS